MTSLTLNSLIKFWWIPVTIALGWFWLHEHDARVRAVALAEERFTQVQLFKDSVATIKDSLAKQDSMLNIQARQAIEARDREARIEANARAASVVAVNKLRATLDSSQQVLLDSVELGYKMQIDALHEQLAHTAELLAIKDQQLAGRDTVINKLEQLNDELSSQLATAVKNIKPSTGDKLARLTPWAIVAALLITR